MPQKCVFDGFNLGLVGSKPERAGGTHSAARRRQRLQELPGWALDARTAFWEEGFRLLQSVRRGEQGHTRVPQKYVVDGYRLVLWINTQRS